MQSTNPQPIQPPQQPIQPQSVAPPTDTGWQPIDAPQPIQMNPPTSPDQSLYLCSGEPISCSDRKPSRTRRFLHELFETVKVFCVVLVLYLLVNQFLFQINAVSGSSMVPTLHSGDRIVVNLIGKTLGGSINRGDIVTIHGDKLRIHLHDIIKRVIAVPGDTIEVQKNQVFVNGELVHEDYLGDKAFTAPKNRGFDQVTLGENEYFVMGDNRQDSTDSRDFGPVKDEAIMGKLLIRFYPLTDIGTVH